MPPKTQVQGYKISLKSLLLLDIAIINEKWSIEYEGKMNESIINIERHHFALFGPRHMTQKLTYTHTHYSLICNYNKLHER